jgi:hypothetical protein
MYFQSILINKGQPSQETNTLKDQLSVVIKAQLDFQQKVDNQISMLQTMMQTVCQLVNNEIVSNKKLTSHTHSTVSNSTSRLRREQADLANVADLRHNWSAGAQSHVSRQTMASKLTPSDDTNALNSRMSTNRIRHVNDRLHS